MSHNGTPRLQRSVRPQRGFLVMAAVFLVVIVGAFVAYLATQSTVQQTTSIGDLGSARALQAARAGVEWGAYTVLRTPADAFVTGCQAGAATKTLTFAGTNLNEYTTTLTCTSSGSLAEGADTVRVYLLIANACNSPLAGACPNAGTTAATYVEREVSATVGCRGASCL